MGWYRLDDMDNLILALHIQPGAKYTEAVGLHGNALKIKLAASPIECKANATLLKFLAKSFHVPLSQIILKQGSKSRHKVIEIRESIHEANILLK